MIILVTRKRGVVWLSVVRHSSALPACAKGVRKASRADKPEIQASMCAGATSAVETGMKRAFVK
jgi:hypothetical protein